MPARQLKDKALLIVIAPAVVAGADRHRCESQWFGKLHRRL